MIMFEYQDSVSMYLSCDGHLILAVRSIILFIAKLWIIRSLFCEFDLFLALYDALGFWVFY